MTEARLGNGSVTRRSKLGKIAGVICLGLVLALAVVELTTLIAPAQEAAEVVVAAQARPEDVAPGVTR